MAGSRATCGAPSCSLHLGCPKIRGNFFRGSHDKDYSILGSILGVPLFRETPIYAKRVFFVFLLQPLLGG